MTNMKVYIDQLRLCNFNVISFGNKKNINRLIEEGVLTINEGMKTYCYAKGGVKFSSIKIIDKEAPFDDLVVSAACGINSGIPHMSSISYSIKDQEFGNIIGFTLEEYKDRIQESKEFLEERYGIQVDFSNLIVKAIELNRTFELADEFNEYSRVLKYIGKNLPPYFNYLNQYKHKQTTTGLSAATYRKDKSKNYQSLKIYNKSAQMRKRSIHVQDNLMRIEFRLVGSQTVEKYLKTNKFNDLREEDLYIYYNDKIDAIKNNLAQYSQSSSKSIYKQMKYERKNHQNIWVVNLLRWLEDEEIKNDGVPVVLDVNNIYPIIDKLIQKPNRRYDTKKRLYNHASNYEKNLCKRDDLKLQELIEKFETGNWKNYATLLP